MATLPQQAPGPGPTAQVLPSYLSYSPAATNVIPYTSTITEVVYDPQGNFAPYQTINIVQGTLTSIDYSIVNVPLLYTGPFPAPPLGTLYTTPGQSPSPETGAPPTATPTQGPETSASDVSPTATPTATAEPSPAGASPPAATQEGSMTVESAPGTPPPASTNAASTPTGASASPTSPPNGTPTGSPSETVTTLPNGNVSTLPSGSLTTLPNGSVSTIPPNTAPASTSPASATNPTSSTGTNNSNSTLSPSNGASSTQHSATAADAPNPRNNATHLSGGQIAGIVLGAFFGLLLLLLLLICCLRRRRSKREQRQVLAAATGGGYGTRGGGGGRGNYAALGAAAAAGTGAAAAGRRGSLASDDWEEDHLTGGGGGSGFFVVGGRRLGSERHSDPASRGSQGSGGFAPSNIAHNVGSSRRNGALAGLGAALLGIATLGRSKRKRRERSKPEEQPLSDDDLGDSSMIERRGLMQNFGSPPSGYGSEPEMREASPRVLDPAAAVLLGGAGLGGVAAFRTGRNHHDSPRSDGDLSRGSQYMPGYGAPFESPQHSGGLAGSQRSSSGLGSSGSPTTAAASSVTARAGGIPSSSSNSTGGFTASGSGTSLRPPPRAPRLSPQQALTLGNVQASAGTPINPPPVTGTAGSSPLLPSGPNPRISVNAASTSSAYGGINPALIGLGAGAVGLGALAAGHRDSDGSSYSRRNVGLSYDVRASNVSGMSAEELNHLRSTDPQRYSAYISSGTNLLGPDYQPSPSPEMGSTGSRFSTPPTQMEPFTANNLSTGSSAQRSRLSTILSVGEFGERSDSSGQKGSQSGSSQRQGGTVSSHGSARHVTPLPVYAPADAASSGGEGLPNYTYKDPQGGGRGSIDTEQNPGSLSEAQAPFITPSGSPVNTLGGPMSSDLVDASGRRSEGDELLNIGERGENDQHGAEIAEAGVASAGILGGVAAGWRRLTMGQYAWVPGGSPISGRGSSTQDSSSDFVGSDGRISTDHGQRPSEDSSRLMHNRRTSRLEASEPGVAPSIRSQRASIYGPSVLGYNTSRSSQHAHTSSKEASGSSGEKAKSAEAEADPRPSIEALGPAAVIGGAGAAAAAAAAASGSRNRSYPSLSSHHSSGRSRGEGYAASYSNSFISGRRAASDSSGLDSLSAVAQLSSRSTGSASTRSGYRSSSRGGRFGGVSSGSIVSSGASTGAASYSPSGVLSRGNTASTRGQRDESDRTAGGGTVDFPSRRSLETDAGGSNARDKRKRSRSSSVDGLSRLDSLREVREAADPFGDIASIPEGAAGSRSSVRDIRQEQSEPAATTGHDGPSGSYLQSQPLPQRTRIRSLQPGTSAPATAVLAPSLSANSLRTASQLDSEATTTMPASASWRPSPRVASAAQRAAEVQASLERADGASASWREADADVPRLERSGLLNRADLESGQDLETAGEEDHERSNKSFEWPKFLRF